MQQPVGNGVSPSWPGGASSSPSEPLGLQRGSLAVQAEPLFLALNQTLMDRPCVQHSDYYHLEGIKHSIGAFGIHPDASRAPDIPVLVLKTGKAFPPARQPLHHTGPERGNNDVRLALGHSLQLDWPPWQKNNREFIASLPAIFTPSCFLREAWIPIPHLKGCW